MYFINKKYGAALGAEQRIAAGTVYDLTLAPEGWNGDSRLRPAWIQVRVGGSVWPDLPPAAYRLNLDNVQADHFGRILRR